MRFFISLTLSFSDFMVNVALSKSSSNIRNLSVSVSRYLIERRVVIG